VAATAGVALVAEVLTVALDPAALRYEPYPSLTAPRVGLPLLAALALLLTPVAADVPSPPNRRPEDTRLPEMGEGGFEAE
jgi:hypothetical protein